MNCKEGKYVRVCVCVGLHLNTQTIIRAYTCIHPHFKVNTFLFSRTFCVTLKLFTTTMMHRVHRVGVFYFLSPEKKSDKNE